MQANPPKSESRPSSYLMRVTLALLLSSTPISCGSQDEEDAQIAALENASKVLKTFDQSPEIEGEERCPVLEKNVTIGEDGDLEEKTKSSKVAGMKKSKDSTRPKVPETRPVPESKPKPGSESKPKKEEELEEDELSEDSKPNNACLPKAP